MCLITGVYGTLATNQCNKVWLLLKVYIALYPSAWVDQRSCQGGYLVIPQRTGWITSYPPIVIGYIMQM